MDMVVRNVPSLEALSSLDEDLFEDDVLAKKLVSEEANTLLLP